MTHSMFTDALAAAHRQDLLADAARERAKGVVARAANRRQVSAGTSAAPPGGCPRE